jgi:hypothetical protein
MDPRNKLTAITFHNYKCFGRPERLELRPLTLLYGRNSAGKSALLRALPILARSVSSEAQSPWDMGDDDGPGMGAPFSSLPWRGIDNNRKFSITLHWSSGNCDTLTLEHDGDEKPSYIKELVLKNSEGERRWQHIRPEQPEDHNYEAPDGSTHTLTFKGLAPDAGQHSDLDQLRARLLTLQGQVQWLHGQRARPPRLIQLRGNQPRALKPNGEDAVLKLRLGLDTLSENDAFFQDVAGYYKAVGRTFKPGLIYGTLRRLLLPPVNQSGWDIDLSDVGQGMSSVLPVLVAAAAATHGQGPPIVAIEDPDTHLHDDAIRTLTDHLASLIARPGSPMTLVLETHSRTLLLAIRKAVMDKRLDPKQVNLVWASPKDDQHIHLEQISINADGSLNSPILRYAFQEDTRLASALAGLSG